MTLETYVQADDLYTARGEDVNARRPVFTGDVFSDVYLPANEGPSKVMVVSHPCAFRGAAGALSEWVHVVPVLEHPAVPLTAWSAGHFAKMPLPDLTSTGLHVGRLDEMERLRTSDLVIDQRDACLSGLGINLLQQRLVWHLTRYEIPTQKFHEAFSHTLEEVDLLEEWCDTLCDEGVDLPDACARFEAFMRDGSGGAATLQKQLQDPQRRTTVRSRCRAEARLQANNEPEAAGQ